jgi:hypothetical protein
MWIVTGILMVYPYADAGREPPPTPIVLDSTVMAPSDALRALSGSGAIGPVRTLQLRQIGDRTVYLISSLGGWHAVDARTGAPFVLAESTAVRIVSTLSPEGATVTGVRTLRAENTEYSGPLPAYRIELGGAVSSSVYMSNIGDISIKSSGGRLKGLAGRLHTFVFPKIPMGVSIRRSAIILASVIAIFLVLTGYFLLLPNKRRAVS